LSDNIYTVKRNEGKYMKRNRAKRSRFVFEVFRPDVVDLMVDARRRLLEVKTEKPFYTDKDIEGLGKNFMSEASRKKAIETYTWYIRYYALLGLKKRLETLSIKSQADAQGVLSEDSEDTRWDHERRTLLREFEDPSVALLLKQLAQMQEELARNVQESKEKDDKRGRRIIDDYAEAHPPAEEDGFVQETWESTRRMREEIEELLALLGQPVSS
jgi:hypothetical protein